MPVSVGLCFWSILLQAGGGVLLAERRPKMGKWVGMVCAVALVCACIAPGSSVAQAASSASNAATTKTKSKPKTTTTKAHTKAAASTAATKAHSTSHPTVAAGNSKSRHTVSGKSSKRKTARGQQKIDAERAQAIQEALIREHYLSGQANGTWNQSSEEAMRRYQADHGWQSKTVPDSRALISLGLGPSHDHLLNPESAMVTGPFPTRSASLTPVSHSADPGAQGKMTPAANSDSAPTPTPAHDPPSPQ